MISLQSAFSEETDIHFTREEAEEERWKFITNFSSRDKFAIDTSVQGSGKTHDGIRAFGLYENSIFLTKSNDKMEIILRRMQKDIPEATYHPIWGLERSCTFYQDDREIQEQVDDLRKMGIDTTTIHMLIHPGDPECPYITQDKSYTGRTVQTFDRFLASIEHGLFRDFQNPRFIYLDEIDGFLDTKSVNIPTNDISTWRFEPVVCNDNYLPDISELIIPPEEKTALLQRYRSLITDEDDHISMTKVVENQYQIKIVSSKLAVVTSHYITGLKNNPKTGMTTVALMPSVFRIMMFLLKHNKLRFMAGSASLRHHRLKFKILEGYFNFARSLIMTNYYNWLQTENNMGTPEWFKKMDKYERLGNLNILEFQSSYIPEANFINYLANDKHSYSNGHYSRLLDGKNPNKISKLRKELETEVSQILTHLETTKGSIKNKKILVITFNELIPFLRQLVYKNRYQSYSQNKNNYFRQFVEILPWFSNKMHGINAQEFFDIILLIGDPLENDVSEYVTKHKLLPERLNKSGFILLPNLPEEVQKLVYESVLTEFIEGIHRSRGEIPVVVIGNFFNLGYGSHIRYKVIKEILDRDRIKPVSIKSDITSKILQNTETN